MMDWIGADGQYHVVVNGSAACGQRIGGSVAASHPCEDCVSALYRMLDTVPGLEVDE